MSALPSSLAFPLAVAAKATLLLALAALAAALMHRGRASAAARHLVWTLACCGLLALPLFSVTLPGWRLGFVRIPAEEPATVAPAAALRAPRLPLPLPAEAPAVDAARSPSPSAPVVPASSGRAVDWGRVMEMAYLLGAAAVLGRMLLGRWSVRRLARSAVPVTDEAWLGLLRDLRWIMDVDRPVALLRGGAAAMPMTWGVRRSFILLPDEADAWPEELRRVVLMHELAHVARHDCLTQTVAGAACALYWFHPGAWYAARRLRVERELACDDRVLSAGARAKEYAAHLLEVARAFRAPSLASVAAVGMARPSQLEGRLLAVLDHLRNRRALTRRGALGAAAAALALVLPLSAARPASAGEAVPRPRVASPARSGCGVRDGESLQCEIPARPGERLTLDLVEGMAARVVAWDRDLVSVRITRWRMDAAAERTAGGVRVAVTRAGGRSGGREPDVVIMVPRRFDVAARADGGGLDIRGVEGTFTGTARGGGVAFSDAAGTVRMDATSGGAYIHHTRLSGRLVMNGGGVMLDVNHGDLDIVGASATVRGSAGALRDWGGRVGADAASPIEVTSDAGVAPAVGVATGTPVATTVAVASGTAVATATPVASGANVGRAVAPAAGVATGVAVTRDVGVASTADAATGVDVSAAPETRVQRVLTGNVAKDGGPIVVSTARPGVRLYTGGGDIRVARAEGDINAETGGGSVTLESVAGGAQVTTGAGDVLVRLTGGGDVDVTSGSGGVTVIVPAGYDGHVELESAYTERHGPTRVASDFPLALSQTREWSGAEGTPRRYVRGRATLGSGRHHIRVRTVNGDVRLQRAGGGGTASATVSGADVTCGAGCTLTLDDHAASGAGTGSWAGGARVIASDAHGYAYSLGNPDDRIAVMRSIARNAPPGAAAEALGRFVFADPEARVQAAAVRALAGLGSGAGRDELRRIAREHPSAAIRRQAAETLR